MSLTFFADNVTYAPLRRLLPALGLCMTWAALMAGCTPQDRQPESNRQMADTLQQVYQDMRPQQNPFLNARRLEILRNHDPGDDPQQRIAHRSQIAEEMLYAGEFEGSAELFESVLDRLEELQSQGMPPPAGFREHLEELTALAWLQHGEQQNCVLNHSSAACIVPIRGEGIHERQEGSRNAIAHYSGILERDEDHLNARWLLNLAYMTLGEYPDQVPDQWLIPQEAILSDHDMNSFMDIAHLLGLDVDDLSGGAIVDDFTGNGYLDVITSSWHLQDQIRLFENNSDGTFTDITRQAGLEGLTGGLNLKHADYTNNGHPDVLVLRGAWMNEDGHHPNSLLRNNGDGTFTDVTFEAGLDSRYPTQAAVWADFNNNGYVDLYIGNETTGRHPHPSELYLNNGDGTFTDIAGETGVDVTGFIKGVDAGDMNNNGRSDLYISRLGQSNLLFRNEGADEQGRPQFIEIGEQAGVQEPEDSFPVWFWDYNNNGHLDLFVSGYRADFGDNAAEYLDMPVDAEYPRLYRNNGDETFTDVTAEKDLDKIMYTMGSNFGDFDNNGWLDFIVGTGDPDMRSIMVNRAFKNDRGEAFHEVSTTGGFANIQKGHSVAFGDLNNNGQQDIYMNLGGALEGDYYQNSFYVNPGHEEHNWITLQLEGVESNRSAIGARIRAVITVDGQTREIHRVIGSGSSFGGNSLQQEIGLGRADVIDELVIRWPASGLQEQFTNVQVNRILRLQEGSGELVERDLTRFEYQADHGDHVSQQH